MIPAVAPRPPNAGPGAAYTVVTAVRSAACLLTLALASALAAGDESHDAIAKLRRMGEVACEPSLPFFCANLHVSCAGRTSIPTFAFRLRVSQSGASIVGTAADAGVAGAAYQQARVEWGDGDDYVLLRPHAGNGYIKLLADGRYSFRHYLQHVGVMSIGLCE